MSNPAPCAFCGKTGVSASTAHDCSIKAYQLLNTLAAPKDVATLFNNIDNLIFQGGGVKGISYLGVIEELRNVNKDILDRTKRIAGTSAGSLMALYMGLQMDLDTEMKPLLDMDYSKLLDNDMKLKVCTNPTNFILSYSYMDPPPSARIVVLSTLQKLKDLQEKIKTSLAVAEEEITEMFYDIIRYYAIYGGTGYNTLASLKATSAAKAASKWLLGLLTPDPEEVVTTPMKRTANFKATNPSEEPVKKAFAMAPLPKPSTKGNIESILDKGFEKALERVRNVQDIPKPQAAPHKNPATLFKVTGPTLAPQANVIEKEETKLDTDGVEGHEDHYQFYLDQLNKTTKEAVEDEPFLDGSNLHYALAEMLWFIIISHELDLGLFTANIIKKTLIEEPIQMKLTQAGITNDNPTFADLAKYEKDGKKLFKDFYVTAFNTSTLRTDVFSASHSPNVSVADAVRASMSIPVFFTPVTIRENGAPKLIYSNNGQTSEPIRYMDGGVFDNYPIWIFDDLKYCFQDTLEAQWKPELKVSIHNPRSLGFRILDQDRIDAYVTPYYDAELTKQRRINNTNYDNSFGYLTGTLAKGGLSEHEESTFVNQGHCPRSAYVDNLGISAIAFDLTETQKEQLINEGRESVKEYIERAKRNFRNEGQLYPAN